MDTGDSRTQARREAEEGGRARRLRWHAAPSSRVRTHALRDAARRHSGASLQTQQGDDQRRPAAAAEEGRTRAHPRLYSIAAAAGAGGEARTAATATEGEHPLRTSHGPNPTGAQAEADADATAQRLRPLDVGAHHSRAST